MLAIFNYIIAFLPVLENGYFLVMRSRDIIIIASYIMLVKYNKLATYVANYYRNSNRKCCDALTTF